MSERRRPTIVPVLALGPRCNERPSPRSSARCELAPGHVDPYHCGRTSGGYWKSWPQSSEGTA